MNIELNEVVVQDVSDQIASDDALELAALAGGRCGRCAGVSLSVGG
jgi:hypothetical protein